MIVVLVATIVDGNINGHKGLVLPPPSTPLEGRDMVVVEMGMVEGRERVMMIMMSKKVIGVLVIKVITPIYVDAVFVVRIKRFGAVAGCRLVGWCVVEVCEVRVLKSSNTSGHRPVHAIPKNLIFTAVNISPFSVVVVAVGIVAVVLLEGALIQIKV